MSRGFLSSLDTNRFLRFIDAPLTSNGERLWQRHFSVMRQFECCPAKDAFSIEKVEILEGWEERKRTLIRPGAKGGFGYVDQDIVPLCDALNRLPGVCTLQSCAGHSAKDSDGPIYSGHLWLRLDQRTVRRFEEQVHRLAADPAIDRVGKIYWEDGKETVTIDFKGNETGLLAEASSTVLDFFKLLCD